MHKRLFIALSYDNNKKCKEIQQLIFTTLEPLVTSCNGVIRVQEHLHMTLYFIGSYPVNEVPQLIDIIKNVIVVHRKDYGFHSLADYNSNISFSVIGKDVIAGIFEPSLILSNLSLLLCEALGKTAKNNERTFLPHITFARVKKICDEDWLNFKIKILLALDDLVKRAPLKIPLDSHEIILFSSKNGIYEPLTTFVI